MRTVRAMSAISVAIIKNVSNFVRKSYVCKSYVTYLTNLLRENVTIIGFEYLTSSDSDILQVLKDTELLIYISFGRVRRLQRSGVRLSFLLINKNHTQTRAIRRRYLRTGKYFHQIRLLLLSFTFTFTVSNALTFPKPSNSTTTSNNTGKRLHKTVHKSCV